jgi:type II secretory pathway component GspD/PulD (secretin)
MFKITPIAAAALLLTGCASQTKLSQADAQDAHDVARSHLSAPVPAAREAVNTVRFSDNVVLPVVEVAPEVEDNWLAKKRLKLRNDKKRPLSLQEIVKMCFDQGIYVTSAQLPLDQYTYSGLGFDETGVEAGLRIVLGPMGLDYDLDEKSQTIVIRPMASRTWYLNVGNRRTSFGSNSASSGAVGIAASGNNQGQTGPNQQQSAQGGGAQQGGQSQSSGGQQQNGQNQGTNVAQSTASAPSGTSISSTDDFWGSLRAELTSRLEVLLPSQAPVQDSSNPPQGQVVPAIAPIGVPNMAMGGQNPMMPLNGSGSQNGGATDMFARKKVGTFALNPETGAITVQAPSWVLHDLDKYLSRVRDMYNSLISFSGEIVMVTTEDNASEGLDISSFARFAKARYGLAYSNNALGGVTVNFSGNSLIPSISSNNAPVANTLLGIASPLDGLQIFNNYLRNIGTVKIVQKPLVAVPSGVPGEFSKTVTRYFNSVSQNTASGGVGQATVGTQNTLTPVDFGTSLRIYPRLDVSTNLIRAQITLNQTIQSGTQNVQQSLNSGANVVPVTQPIPIVTRLLYQGEALLADGDLIVVGGQTDDETDSTDGGVPGLKDGVLSPIFGQKSNVKRVGTYYFALRVSVQRQN